MEYLMVFGVVLAFTARSRMIATASSSADDHATLGGTTENEAKYHEIFHFDDPPPRAPRKRNRSIVTKYAASCSLGDR